MTVPRKVACYCMTRNIYHKVEPSLNSLLRNSSVERVYILAEDDDIGFELPGKVRVINVRGQTYFPESGKNYHNPWTWMVLMKCALHRVLPGEDLVLCLDLDTIVDKDIDGIWDTPGCDWYVAGVREPAKSSGGFVYINGGVVLYNLARLRDGKGDEIIRALNEKEWSFPDQECISHLCAGHIMQMSNAYNACDYTGYTRHVKIWHFAAKAGWYTHEPIVQKYKEKI